MLLKNLKNLLKGKPAKGIFAYINKINKLLELRCKATTVEEFLSFDNLSKCLSLRAVFHIKEVLEMIKDSKEKGIEEKVWMNELYALDVEKMTRAHLVYLMFSSSRQVLAEHEFKDKNINKVLDLVCQLFAVK